MAARGAKRAPAGAGGTLRPLHGGRHSLPPDVVAFNQRERLLAALAAVVAEHGYNKATVAQVTAAASVSRRTFYENFADKQDAFFAAYDALDAHIGELVEEAARGRSEWSERLAAALAAFVGFLASRPSFARLYLVEAAAVGEGMAARRRRSAQRFVALLEPGRAASDRELAEDIEEALVGGIVSLLARRILAGETAHLERFIPAAIEFALAPYLGLAAARRIAAEHGVEVPGRS